MGHTCIRIVADVMGSPSCALTLRNADGEEPGLTDEEVVVIGDNILVVWLEESYNQPGQKHQPSACSTIPFTFIGGPPSDHISSNLSPVRPSRSTIVLNSTLALGRPTTVNKETFFGILKRVES